MVRSATDSRYVPWSTSICSCAVPAGLIALVVWRMPASAPVGLERDRLRVGGLVGDDQDDRPRPEAARRDLDPLVGDRRRHVDRGGRPRRVRVGRVLRPAGARARDGDDGERGGTDAVDETPSGSPHGRNITGRTHLRLRQPPIRCVGAVRSPASPCTGAFKPSGPGRMTQGPHDRRDAPRRPARLGRVPRRGHGDQRPRRRALRAHGGRRGAGRRRRAARSLVLPRRRARAAVARHPAPDRHQPGDGGRRAPPEAVLPELARRLHNRVLVAHSARFDQGVLRQAFARAALTWPEPPVLCTVALARRFAPLQRRRGLAALADALGIEVATVHRALPDAETCARVFCALFARLCAHAATVGEALAQLRPRRTRCARRGRASRAASAPTSPRCPRIPASTSSATPTATRSTSASRSACARAPARTSPSRRRGPAQAAHVDHEPTESELGALVLENRLIKALRPPGNVRGKRTADGYVVPALPARHRVPDPRGRARARRRAQRDGRPRAGPRRARRARRAAQLAVRPAPLRPYARRRRGPSAYGQMGRCLSPCLGDLDPNLYRARLDEALELFVSEPDGGAALLAHIDRQMRRRRRSGASSAPPGCSAAAHG